ncbi:MAG: TM2 domain-containing protein [Candidatus Magnetoovum sp. WYHC-5]|nr:TM2 domain-containing protein [Candidatus Magnetoovum sp. WYHC-5]
MSVEESTKSRLIALILCFLLGWVGAHRFYVNKIGTGILMMMTMGGFGMWYFLDIVMISLGAFKDKDNRLITKWSM